MSEERKRETRFEYVGYSEKEAIVVNELREKLEEVKQIHETNVKQLEDTLEQLNIQAWFLENSRKVFRGAKGVQQKYNNFRDKQLDVSKKEIVKYEGMLKDEKKLLDNITAYITDFESHTTFEVLVDDDIERVVKIAYDREFYLHIVGLAKVIGLIELSE